MTRPICRIAAGLLLALPIATPAAGVSSASGDRVVAAGAGAGDASAGQREYEARCSGCHSIDENRAGPAHRGVFGRVAGSAPGFDYSAAVKASGVVWNDRTLDAWLADPQAFIPGQAMFVQVEDAGVRRDLVAYLATLSK